MSLWFPLTNGALSKVERRSHVNKLGTTSLSLATNRATFVFLSLIRLSFKYFVLMTKPKHLFYFHVGSAGVSAGVSSQLCTSCREEPLRFGATPPSGRENISHFEPLLRRTSCDALSAAHFKEVRIAVICVAVICIAAERRSKPPARPLTCTHGCVAASGGGSIPPRCDVDVNAPRCTFNVMSLYYRHLGMDRRASADLFNI